MTDEEKKRKKKEKDFFDAYVLAALEKAVEKTIKQAMDNMFKDFK